MRVKATTDKPHEVGTSSRKKAIPAKATLFQPKTTAIAAIEDKSKKSKEQCRKQKR